MPELRSSGIYIIYLYLLPAVGRHTHVRHSRCRDNPSGDSGRGALQLRRGGNARAVPRAICAWQPSVQVFVCLRVDRGCRTRPRSRHLSSGRCGSCSVHQSSIQDGLALSFRLVGSRSGSRYRASSPACDATYLSERPNSSGRVSLQNSG